MFVARDGTGELLSLSWSETDGREGRGERMERGHFPSCDKIVCPSARNIFQPILGSLLMTSATSMSRGPARGRPVGSKSSLWWR